MADPVSRPAADEVEFTAFSPGYGECLVVHLGEGEWAIVDSCISADRMQPATEYLGAMGVDVTSAVKLVVATHWHDDHVRGISKVVEACPEARFACSAALNGDELLRGMSAMRRERFESPHMTSGVEEMRRTFTLLAPGTAAWSIEGRLLYQRLAEPTCRVTALSPSDKVQSRAYDEIRQLVISDPAARVRRPDRNLSAVVLWVEVGDVAMLLGADLQERNTAHRGWSAILNCRTRPPGRAEVFKIPHHGSANAHHTPVWSNMLVANPHHVVCPCANGRTDLPTDSDIERLCGLGDVHLTAPSRSDLTRRNGRRRRPKIAAFGRVTLRRPIGGTSGWAVEYDPPSHDPCRR